MANQADKDRITLQVEIQKEATNETSNWQSPSARAVAAFIQERVVGMETDDGWLVTGVVGAGARAKYDAQFGDERECARVGCHHPYYRHFDTYEQMRPVGCKYCLCDEFLSNAPA
jgi:hypothetical protein